MRSPSGRAYPARRRRKPACRPAALASQPRLAARMLAARGPTRRTSDHRHRPNEDAICAYARPDMSAAAAGRVDRDVMTEILNEPIASTLDEAAGFLDTQAGRVASLRDRLAQEDITIPLIDCLAEELDGLGDRLAGIGDDEVVDTARQRARRRDPWLFAAAGAAIGLVAWGGLRRAGATEEPSSAVELESSTER